MHFEKKESLSNENYLDSSQQIINALCMLAGLAHYGLPALLINCYFSSTTCLYLLTTFLLCLRILTMTSYLQSNFLFFQCSNEVHIINRLNEWLPDTNGQLIV